MWEFGAVLTNSLSQLPYWPMCSKGTQAVKWTFLNSGSRGESHWLFHSRQTLKDEIVTDRAPFCHYAAMLVNPEGLKWPLSGISCDPPQLSTCCLSLTQRVAVTPVPAC